MINNSLPEQLNSLDVSEEVNMNNIEEIDVKEVLKSLWLGKIRIALIMSLFFIASFFYAESLPDIYKSDALLSPSNSVSGNGVSPMSSQIGGIASFAGLGLGKTEISQSDLAVEIIKSRKFIINFIKKHNIEMEVMAVDGWDENSAKLVINNDIYDEVSKEWVNDEKGAGKLSDISLYRSFTKNNISVSKDKDSGLYTLSVKHYSPFIAKKWVDLLILDINDVMRQRAIFESKRNLEYLKGQLQKTSITNMQNTFYSIIEEQTKTLMIAESQEEFVFEEIDPSVVTETPYAPKRFTVVSFSTFLGLLLGVLITLVSRKKPIG